MSIIDTIDHALHDWETSDDAMRWTADTSVLEAAPEEPDLEAAPRAISRMAVILGEWANGMQVAFMKVTADLARALHPETTVAPPGPAPLCIDGAAYRRRTRARQRRH